MSATFSRRSLLLTTPLLGLVVGGCEVRSPLEERPEPTPLPVDPDLALRDSVRVAIAAQIQLLAAVARADPGEAAKAAPLTAMHQAHLGALPGDDGSSSPTAPPTGTPATWAQALVGEIDLQKRLGDAAQSAESGPFARLLASMAAAIGQRVSP